MTSAGHDDPFERGLVEAIHSSDVPAFTERVLADPGWSRAHRARAESVRATLQRIGARLEVERTRVLDLLAAADVAASPFDGRETPALAQRHLVDLAVGVDDIPRAIEILEGAGYLRQHRWTGGAQMSLLRVGDHVDLARSDDVTLVIRLRWRSQRQSSRPSRLFRPTPADWDMVELPGWAWSAYSAVRPVRLVLERLGMRNDDHAALEPFLVTPMTLIDPILDVADPGPSDTLLDAGCGDGRIVVRAARRFGCSALGVEQSADTATAATRNVEAAGLGGRVGIVHADLGAVELSDVTVAVLFVPMRVALRVLPDLLERLSPGAVVILHEQTRLPDVLPTPTRSVPLCSHDALTVAHRWDVGPAR